MKKYVKKTKSYAQVLKMNVGKENMQTKQVEPKTNHKEAPQPQNNQEGKNIKNEHMKQIIVKMEQQINILKSILGELCESINIEKEKKNKIKAIIKEIKPIIIEESKIEKNQSKIKEVNENRDINNKRKEDKKVL